VRFYDELYAFCTVNNILSSKQSGFRKSDGTVNQLLNLTDNVYKSFEEKKEVAMVFLDISKAFDRVWHDGLVYKLQCVGIEGALLLLLRDYLCNRRQSVVLAGHKSGECPTNAGVPQGSILGPLLFLIFINDIEKDVSSDMSLFADDTSLARAYSDPREAEGFLNNDLHIISRLAQKWMVEFNFSKTVFINFSLKAQKSILHLIFNGNTVTQVPNHKHLGFVLSEDMKWKNHVT